MKSQNNESAIALDYFNRFHPDMPKTVLSIGENDGVTFSNSYDLIEAGWHGVLLEPSDKAFAKLSELYKDNDRVMCFHTGIAAITGKFKFKESGSYENGSDVALYSTLVPSETERWKGKVEFEDTEAMFMDWQYFNSHYSDELPKTFDYITIDAEGYDLIILEQINLAAFGCKLLCIEHNGNADLIAKYTAYAEHFGLKEFSINAENIIFGDFLNLRT